MARKLWQKASAQRRGPRSTGKATQGRAEEAPAKPPGPASCNDMLLAGSLACKSKASCGQVLAGKKASARIWSKTVRFLCCHIKNLSAGWPPSCCQVLAAWQKQGKARKAKPGHPGKVSGGQDAPVTGPGCTGKARQGKPGQDTQAKSAAPARGQEALGKPPGMARKLWQKASAQRRGPGSTGKATQGRAEEAPSTGPASCNDMLLAGSLACKSKASCGQVLAGKKASARIWSKTVRFLCCHIKNLSAGWPPSCCQVLAAWQKQGKARKAKPGHPGKVSGGQDAPVTGPGCTGKARQGKPGQDTQAKSAAPARGQEALGKPPGMARKLWQKASAQRRGPGSTGKATQGRAEEAPAKPPGGAGYPGKAPGGWPPPGIFAGGSWAPRGGFAGACWPRPSNGFAKASWASLGAFAGEVALLGLDVTFVLGQPPQGVKKAPRGCLRV